MFKNNNWPTCSHLVDSFSKPPRVCKQPFQCHRVTEWEVVPSISHALWRLSVPIASNCMFTPLYATCHLPYLHSGRWPIVCNSSRLLPSFLRGSGRRLAVGASGFQEERTARPRLRGHHASWAACGPGWKMQKTSFVLQCSSRPSEKT